MAVCSTPTACMTRSSRPTPTRPAPASPSTSRPTASAVGHDARVARSARTAHRSTTTTAKCSSRWPGAAGQAIRNAQLYDDSDPARGVAGRLGRRSTRRCSAADPSEALSLVAAGARRLARADVAWIEVAHDGGADAFVSIDACDGHARRRSCSTRRCPRATRRCTRRSSPAGEPIVHRRRGRLTRRLVSSLPILDAQVGPAAGGTPAGQRPVPRRAADRPARAAGIGSTGSRCRWRPRSPARPRCRWSSPRRSPTASG